MTHSRNKAPTSQDSQEPPQLIHPAQLWFDFPDKTQSDVAEAMGVHPTTVSTWVRKTRKPTNSNKVLAAKVYGEWLKQASNHFPEQSTDSV